jgi:hypothetical protein
MNLKHKKITSKEIGTILNCKDYTDKKVQELMGEKDFINIVDILNGNISDLDKILGIERLGLMDEMFMRTLALRYTKSTFPDVEKELKPEAAKLVKEGIEVLTKFFNGEASPEQLLSSRNRTREFLVKELEQQDHNKAKRQLGILEMVLAVSNASAMGSLREVSSIQRDILGEAIASKQVEQMSVMVHNIYGSVYEMN